MAITLTERPYRFGFSKNEARYVFTVTNPASLGCAVELKLFCHTIESVSAPPELITELKLYPSPDGTVIFYANDYFESILQLNMPAAGALSPLNAVDQQKYYWVEFRQITNLAPNNPWVITERTRKRVMLLGGIEVQKYERNNFFENLLIPDKKWLTWLPTNRFVGVTQEHYLSWLKAETDADDFKMKVKVVYTDATEDASELDLPSGNNFLYHMPTGVNQLGLNALNPAKTIHYYEVWIENIADGIQANPYRFYIDFDHVYKKFDWVYLNSLGGLDAVRIKGPAVRDIEREVSSASQLNVMTEINDAIKSGDTIDTGILLNKKWKGDIGYLNSPGDQDGIADVLASLEVFENMNDRWLRVRLLNKTQPMGGSDDTKWNFPLEWVYAYTNDKYTPDDQLLGDGDNENEVYDGIVSACPSPTGLAAAETGVDMGLSSVQFTWTHPGSVLITIQTKEDGAVTWEDTFVDVSSAAELIAQFVADGRTMNWRLKLKCPNEDESVYVNGPDFVLTNDASYCALPGALLVELGAPTGGNIPVTFSWTHIVPAPNFKLQYKKLTDVSWTDVNVAALTTTIDFPDDGSEYQWRVSALCAVDSISTPVNGYNFVASSSSTCTVPYNLDKLLLSATEDTVTYLFTWDHPGALSYLIQIKYGSGGAWTDYTSLTDSKEITVDIGLIVYWRVAAQCVGDYSAFANGTAFYPFI
jgi:hypothetical protein